MQKKEILLEHFHYVYHYQYLRINFSRGGQSQHLGFLCPDLYVI